MPPSLPVLLAEAVVVWCGLRFRYFLIQDVPCLLSRSAPSNFSDLLKNKNYGRHHRSHLRSGAGNNTSSGRTPSWPFWGSIAESSGLFRAYSQVNAYSDEVYYLHLYVHSIHAPSPSSRTIYQSTRYVPPPPESAGSKPLRSCSASLLLLEREAAKSRTDLEAAPATPTHIAARPPPQTSSAAPPNASPSPSPSSPLLSSENCAECRGKPFAGDELLLAAAAAVVVVVVVVVVCSASGA